MIAGQAPSRPIRKRSSERTQDPAAIDPGGDLSQQLDIDLMDFLNVVVVSVHEQTGIEIPERNYPKLLTLDDAVAYLAAAQQQGLARPKDDR